MSGEILLGKCGLLLYNEGGYNMPGFSIQPSKTKSSGQSNLTKEKSIDVIKHIRQQKALLAKRKIVDRYMKQYHQLINKTISKNNNEIYAELLAFLSPQKMGFAAGFEEGVKGLIIQGITPCGVGMNGLVSDCNS